MQVAAQLADMSVDEFRSINPGHTRPVIMSNGSRTLLLPVDKAGVFSANLQGYDQPLVSWHTYTLEKNERPDSVAAQFAITPAPPRGIHGPNPKSSLRPRPS